MKKRLSNVVFWGFSGLVLSLCIVQLSFGMGTIPEEPEKPAKLYKVSYNEFIYITSQDGTTLCGNMFTPTEPVQGDGGYMPETFPAIIFPNSWAVEEHEYIMQAKAFAEKGYITLSYSARGWGFSGGQVNTVGPKDMEDVTAVIDWVIENTPVDVNNIAMAGISYGSGISLIGAAHDPRVKTVAAMSCWGSIVDALYDAQTPRLVWGGILVGSGKLTGRLEPELSLYYQQLLNNENVDELIAWGLQRSPITYAEAFNSRNVPIYLSPNLQDEMFRPNSVMRLYDKLQTPKRMDITNGIHASSEALGLVGIPNKVWDTVHDWMDHFLKGEDTGVFDADPVTIDIKRSQTDFVALEGWPSERIETTPYYLGERNWYELNGSLSEGGSAKSGSTTIDFGKLSGANTGIPVISAFFEAHTPLQITAFIPTINRNIAAVYETDRFDDNKVIAGIPTLDLYLEPHQEKAQIIAHLYDMGPFGVGTLITHGPFTIHDAIPGEPVKASFECVVTAYEMKKGHKLVLAIDTYDVNYGVPTTDPFTVTFHYSETYPSVLSVPYVR